MLLLIQFPIADLRPFRVTASPMLAVPTWPEPNTYRRFVRSFGPTRRRLTDPSLGVWQDELFYCNAHRGVRFSRLEKQLLAPAEMQAPPRGAFRRLFCDGGPSVRVEVAVEVEARRPVEPRDALLALRHFLDLETRVLLHGTAGESDADADDSGHLVHVAAGSLFEQGTQLTRLWLKATTPIGLAADGRDADACVPLVVIGYRSNELAQLPCFARRVDPELVGGGGLAYLAFKHHGVVIGVWLLDLDSAAEDQRRKLRIATLRLHAEQQVLMRVVQQIRGGLILYRAGGAASKVLAGYLNRATGQLQFKAQRFGVDQPILRATIAAQVAAVGPDERTLLRAALEELQPQILHKLDRVLQPKSVPVFVSFSRQDGEQWLGLVERALKPLDRAGYIRFWADKALKAGQNWDQEILRALTEARVVVLLVGPGLLASEYVAERELPLILERHRRGEIDLIPLFLLPVPKITAGELLAIQGINQPTEPFAGMTDVEQSACLATLVDRLGDLLQIERV
jgi:hypothetical protein